jgi:hypothetical protein
MLPMVHRLCVGKLEMNVLRPTLPCVRRVVGDEFGHVCGMRLLQQFTGYALANMIATCALAQSPAAQSPHHDSFGSMLNERPRERRSASQQPCFDQWRLAAHRPRHAAAPFTAPHPLSHTTAFCLSISALFSSIARSSIIGRRR